MMWKILLLAVLCLSNIPMSSCGNACKVAFYRKLGSSRRLRELNACLTKCSRATEVAVAKPEVELSEEELNNFLDNLSEELQEESEDELALHGWGGELQEESEDELALHGDGSGKWTAYLIHNNVECRSGDVYLGTMSSVKECAIRVGNRGGTYFIFGTGRKRGKCYWERTESASCPETFERDNYDFWEVTISGLCYDYNYDLCTSSFGQGCKSMLDMGPSHSHGAIYQRKGKVYKSGGNCYKALSGCWDCLKPAYRDINPAHLKKLGQCSQRSQCKASYKRLGDGDCKGPGGPGTYNINNIHTMPTTDFDCQAMCSHLGGSCIGYAIKLSNYKYCDVYGSMTSAPNSGWTYHQFPATTISGTTGSSRFDNNFLFRYNGYSCYVKV